MGAAIRSGRALELDCAGSAWGVEDAAELGKVLALPSCRVSTINCTYGTGDGVAAMAAAVCGCVSAKSIK